jgi:hypothetical protein
MTDFFKETKTNINSLFITDSYRICQKLQIARHDVGMMQATRCCLPFL